MAPTVQPPGRIHVLEIIGNAIVGGMENSVQRLIERLPPDRFEVSVLCPFESPYTDRLRALGAEVDITPIHDDAPWSSIQFACALAKSKSVDIFHSHLQNAHVLAGLAGRLSGKPVLATVHGRQLSSLDLEVHRTAGTHLHVVCKQSYFHALGVGANPGQVHLVTNGVDTDVFKPAVRTMAGLLRQRFGIPAQAPVIGFVGRLSPEKGPDVFLRMALGVRQAHPEAHFLVVGDGPMRSQLKGFIELFDLSARVHLAGMQTDMPSVMGELDIFVSSSHSEAMPLALMEAMASGLPVIATRVGGVPDLLQHDVTGWLAHPGDYEGLASRAVDMLQDDSLRLTTGTNGRQRAVDCLSLSKSIDATMALLTRLVNPIADPRRIGTIASNGKLVNGMTASNGKAALS
ncbi:MAG: glycosyltransferase family 4 protein [Caldimonas sp.]